MLPANCGTNSPGDSESPGEGVQKLELNVLAK